MFQSAVSRKARFTNIWRKAYRTWLTDGTCRKLKELYDGYHFTPNSEGIYNPFSILRAMNSGVFASYWFETGTPTYLVTLLKQGKCDLSEMASTVTDVETLDSVYGDDEPIPVIYQSGYLTIKGYDPEFETYTLGFPNKEVEEGFMKFLVPYYTPIRKSAATFEIKQFVMDIRSGNIDAFMTRLQSFMADTPYELISDQELHYQNVMFIVSKLLGFYALISCSRPTNTSISWSSSWKAPPRRL